MNGFERHARDTKIVALVSRGFSVPQVAAKFEISTKRVREVMEEWRSTNPTLRSVDPVKIIDEMIVGYQADIEQLAEIADRADNDNAAVGAINARMAARDRVIALLQTTGVLPHDLGKLRIDHDVRFIATAAVTILNRYGVSDEAQQALLRVLESGQLIDPAMN